MNPSDDAEHVYNGYLTIGDQKKGGTHISFKDKCRRYFVLRCLKQRLLTLSGYKNAKDFTSPRGHLLKNVEQIVLTKDSKIHSMHFPVKKHKQSNVLCIFKDRQMTYYLEADTREDLDAWCKALNDVFVRLGWKENSAPPPLPSPPPRISTSTEPTQCSSDEQPSSLRPNGNTTDRAVKSADTFRPHETRERAFSDQHQRPSTPEGGPSSYYEQPSRVKKTSADETVHCCARAHVMLPGSTNPDLYVNVHNVPDKNKWLEETQLHHERLVSIRDIYANLPSELHHPEPPQLPPRELNHKRSGTFPGAHTPPSSPLQLPRHSSGELPEKCNQSRCHDAANVPTINLPDVPASPFTRQYPHLFDDSEAARRNISLAQSFNLPQRRINGQAGVTASAPASPVMMRKAGSQSNLFMNLTNRPLPSPIKGDSFDFNTLKWEISHTDFRVDLDKDDLQDKLALVRIGDYVWIAGWKSGRSILSKKLHVGDQLRQINEQIVVDPVIAHTLFSTSANDKVLLIVRRLPHAKVRHLHRSTKAESWGFEVEGNRVVQVSKCGPASDAKMTPRAQGAFSERLCDWIITEVDGEPVSLLGKKDEVKHRMASAGLEMTLTIQPDDFIKRLKAELQKVKFYHEYFLGADF